MNILVWVHLLNILMRILRTYSLLCDIIFLRSHMSALTEHAYGNIKNILMGIYSSEYTSLTYSWAYNEHNYIYMTFSKTSTNLKSNLEYIFMQVDFFWKISTILKLNLEYVFMQVDIFWKYFMNSNISSMKAKRFWSCLILIVF